MVAQAVRYRIARISGPRLHTSVRHPDPELPLPHLPRFLMAWSKEEKRRRRAEAAGPYPKPRGHVPRGSNGARKYWDKQIGGWHEDAQPLPMTTNASNDVPAPRPPPAPPIAAVPVNILQQWVPAAPQSADVQRREHASPSHPGSTRVHLTARTSTPRQRPVHSSYLREPMPEAIRQHAARGEELQLQPRLDSAAARRLQLHESNRAWSQLNIDYPDEPMRKNRNEERERCAKRKLQPDKYALYCERERARKARARKEGGEVDEADEDEDRELV